MTDVSDYLSQRRVAEVQLREATTLARSIVENLNAGFYLRLRQEMFSGSQESAAKHSSLDDARTTLTAYRGRLAKYHGRVAHKLAGLIDRIELRGMPDAMRHERRVLVQVCEVLENVITAHHGAVDTFAQLLLASDEALSWERLYSEAVVKVVARSTPQKAASASPPLPEQSVEAAAAAADDDDTNPLTALGDWMARGAKDLHSGVQSLFSEAAAAAAAPVATSASGASAAPATPATTAETLKAEGNRRVASRDFSGAIECYSRAVRRACVAHELERGGGGGAGEGQQQRQLHIYLGNRAAAHLHAGLYVDAVADCRAALALEPTFAKHYARLGSAQLKLGRVDDAVACFRTALDIEPSLSRARLNLAEAEGQQQKQQGQQQGQRTENTGVQKEEADGMAMDVDDDGGGGGGVEERRAAIAIQMRALQQELATLEDDG